MPEPGDKPDPTPDPSKPDKDETDWKAKYEATKEASSKWEKRAKENVDKARKFDELEESQKTELQKSADAQTAAEERAAKAERDAVRWRIAAKKGLTETQAKRLIGDTEDELEADADELLASFQDNGSRTDPVPGRPKEALRSGVRPNDEAEPDVREVVAKIPRSV